MRNVRRVQVTDIWSWYRVELRVGDHLGRSEELVSRCIECDLAEPESLASLGGSAPGVVDGILSITHMEFESDDDVAEPLKNAANAKKEGKVRVKKKTVHYYEFSSDEEEGAHADPKKNEKPMLIKRIRTKKVKMIKHLSPMK